MMGYSLVETIEKDSEFFCDHISKTFLKQNDVVFSGDVRTTSFRFPINILTIATLIAKSIADKKNLIMAEIGGRCFRNKATCKKRLELFLIFSTKSTPKYN